MQENYIVRIYRRDKDRPHQIAGIVEHIESAQQLAFHNPGDLIEFLHLSRCQGHVDDTRE